MVTDIFILDNFENALRQGYIQVYYQPVIRTMSRKLCSFEALARWVDPVKGVIRPDEFIPVLEKNKLIHILDQEIIKQVCTRIRDAIDSGDVSVPVSVNLSRLDFSLCDIYAAADALISRYEIPHDHIYIEITESIMAEREGRMLRTVERFRSAGFQVWMDDFGSAYSSLNVLKDFAFDEIKLDMQFLSSFDLRSRRIMSSVIQMAKEIGIHTLAEGVETEDQFNFLRNIGCEKVQGYYFGKPMPYDEAMRHLGDIGVEVERAYDRKYYDDIGKINLLSAVPFMTKEERDSLTSARQLNSIPLAIAEARQDSFSILFYNTAFEETLSGAGYSASIFSQDMLCRPQPYSILPVKVINLMDSTRQSKEGRMYFISNEEYYELQAKCVAETADAYSVLFRLSNLSKAMEMKKTAHLDEGLRQIYTLFERITLFDLEHDSITPLYVAIREDLVSGRKGLKKLGEEYARNWIFPEDREKYLEFADVDTLPERIEANGGTYITSYFRAAVSHGNYAWKRYTYLRYTKGSVIELISSAEAETEVFSLKDKNSEAGITPELLWNTIANSDIIRMFWKDGDRRFLGVTRGFIDYYGFGSAEELRGKNDEDLGWHIHPDNYMNDELNVIREGISTHNVPGRCIANGENREILASKTPIYGKNGEIMGLLGYFIDKELLTINDSRGQETKRRDILTGLLNSRGIAEEAHAFQDEYYLRNVDFVRFQVAIDDFDSLNHRYGYDFGDRAIKELGAALKRGFGFTSAVGRVSGHQFVILHQVKNHEELIDLTARIKEIASGIRQIDGITLTLYLSVGYSLFSEYENLDEQAQKAEIRLLADQDERATAGNRVSRSSEIFHLYDELPIPYAVYKVITDEQGKVSDAVVFYVNHAFEEIFNVRSVRLLGQNLRKAFPALGEEWYHLAERAAILGEKITERVYYDLDGKKTLLTASRVIGPGYCCFTYQEDIRD